LTLAAVVVVFRNPATRKLAAAGSNKIKVARKRRTALG
jgi:hypothetical protein